MAPRAGSGACGSHLPAQASLSLEAQVATVPCLFGAQLGRRSPGPARQRPRRPGSSSAPALGSRVLVASGIQQGVEGYDESHAPSTRQCQVYVFPCLSFCSEVKRGCRRCPRVLRPEPSSYPPPRTPHRLDPVPVFPGPRAHPWAPVYVNMCAVLHMFLLHVCILCCFGGCRLP